MEFDPYTMSLSYLDVYYKFCRHVFLLIENHFLQQFSFTTSNYYYLRYFFIVNLWKYAHFSLYFLFYFANLINKIIIHLHPKYGTVNKMIMMKLFYAILLYKRREIKKELQASQNFAKTILNEINNANCKYLPS